MTLHEAEYAAVPIAANALYADGLPRLSERPLTPVSGYPAPRQDPLCYPGERPDGSFTIAAGEVLPAVAIETPDGPRFAVNTTCGVFDLNDVLASYNVPDMAARYPIVGFGSNACPGQLGEKFSAEQDEKGHIQTPGDHHVVPTLRGSIENLTPTYSKLGIRGYMFVDLLPDSGALTEVFVNFLTPAQLERMKLSESAYELCELGRVALDGLATPIPAYMFLGKNPVILNGEGKAIRPAALASNSPLPAMTQTEVLQMICNDFSQQIEAQYPHAPFFARTAADLAALVSYRHEFVRRAKTPYKQRPAVNESPDPLLGAFIQGLFSAAGRLAATRLLDEIPPGRRDMTPRPFGVLYSESKESEPA